MITTEEIEALKTEIAEASAIKDMLNNSPGWKVVAKILEERRQKAFEAWTESTEIGKDAFLKYEGKVLKSLLQEIEDKVRAGITAQERLKEAEQRLADTSAEVDLEEEVPDEVRALTDPSIKTQGQLNNFFQKTFPGLAKLVKGKDSEKEAQSEGAPSA